MIRQLNLNDSSTTTTVLALQQAAYRVEAEITGFNEIPPLFDNEALLQGSGEVFYGYFVDSVLAGAIAYEIKADTLDICRMMVHPDYFRRGIASALLRFVEILAPDEIDTLTVSTGTLNSPARQLYERHGFVFSHTQTITKDFTLTHYIKRLV